MRPLGSRLLSDDISLREVPGALGSLRSLPDELLVQIFGLVSAKELARCAGTSRAMRVLAHFEEFWKARMLEELPDDERLRYHAGGWRCTYLAWQHRQSGPTRQSETNEPPFLADLGPSEQYYYSDVLFAPWHCGTAAIPPHWSRVQSVTRVDASELSVADFATRFEVPGTPVVIRGVVEKWPAYHSWTEAQLRTRFGNGPGFHVGGHTMGLEDFFDYCHSTHDEQPLYLFDKRFGETSACGGADEGLAADYVVPTYFDASRDLFASLKSPHRPDHRWLIAGGSRSGSSWHVDPNKTCAWNACVVGRKKWILCPPGKPPPGVDASADGITVTSPVSLYEWFRVFYSSLRELQREGETTSASDGGKGDLACLEVTVEAGEILFVPAGWWHCCLNLEPSIAITQNYAPFSSGRSILNYFRYGGDSDGLHVSGIPLSARPSMAGAFADVLAAVCPQALMPEAATEAVAGSDAGAKVSAVHHERSAAKLGLMGSAEEQGTGFSFGFG